MSQRPDLEKLLTFPHLFIFRAIGTTEDSLVDRCRAAVEESIGRPSASTESAPSSAGRYTSVRVGAVVLNAEEIHATFRALHAVEGVRMVL